MPPASVNTDSERAAERIEAERVRAGAEMLYSQHDIESAIGRMAREAAAVVAGTNPIVLPVMLGGLFTAVRLSAHFEFPYQVDRLEVGRYGSGLEGRTLEWRVEPGANLEGRVVLVVDDVLDRGVTLAAVQDKLATLGVAAQYSAVLVDKQLREARDRPTADFSGVRCDDRYLFGCGMDYKGYWRGLPALYALDDQ